jgi:hypothetical protein
MFDTKINISVGNIELSVTKTDDVILDAWLTQMAMEKLFALFLTENLTKDEIREFCNKETATRLINKRKEGLIVKINYEYLESDEINHP